MLFRLWPFKFAVHPVYDLFWNPLFALSLAVSRKRNIHSICYHEHLNKTRLVYLRGGISRQITTGGFYFAWLIESIHAAYSDSKGCHLL